MKSNNELIRISKYMSMLLRHKPEKENLVLDKHGYASTKSLCNALKLNQKELDWIVNNNNKKRFSYKNEKKDYIRANQGHSINIDLKLKLVEPPDLPPLLFHGTSWKKNEIIYEEGLKKMSRHHVHLSDNIDTAYNVGNRQVKKKSEIWIITINVKKMWENGYDFFISENGVYFTDHVPSIYFEKDSTNDRNGKWDKI